MVDEVYDPKAAIEKLTQTLTVMGRLMSQQQVHIQKHGERLDSVLTALEKGGNSGSKKPDDDNEEELDEDQMDNLKPKDIIKLVVNEVGKIVDQKVKTLGDRIDQVDSTFKGHRVETDVKSFASGKKDFFDWSDEIAKIAKAHPTLSIKQMYSLAREDDPKKAKELDAKYDPPKDEKRQAFGGLTPTSGKSFSGAKKGDKPGEGKLSEPKPKVTALEAAAAAFDEVMSGLPEGSAQFGTDVPSSQPQVQ